MAAEITPGYKTTEFWFTLLANVLVQITTLGLISDTSVWFKLIGAVVSILSVYGYTAQRSALKALAAKVQ